jgi:hypothetical protein
MAKKTPSTKSKPRTSRKRKSPATTTANPVPILDNPFRAESLAYELFQRLRDGKPISKLALFRGLETNDPNSLLRDLRKRSMVLSFDRTTTCYQLRQVGCIVLTPEDIQ